MNSVFEVCGAVFSYASTGQRVLDGADLVVPTGGRICLVGPNGAGKSTLLYHLGLLCEEPLQAGHITCTLPGQAPLPLASLTPRERGQLRGVHFGFALQEPYLMPQLTAAENVAMPLLLQGWTPDDAVGAARELMHRAGGSELADRHGHFIDNLSGGQQQLLSVLRALVHSPLVLFADEPIKGLDARNQDRFCGLLDDWHSQAPADRPRTLLLVLHETHLVRQLADYIVFFRSDHKIRDGRAFSRAEVEEEARADGINYEDRIRRWIVESR